MYRYSSFIVVFLVILIGVSCGDDKEPIGPTVDQTPLVNIISPDDGSIFAEGDPVNLIGGGWDPQDGILGDSALVWSSNVDSSLGIGDNNTVTSLSLGDHQIILICTDSDGNHANTSVSIQVSVPESAYVQQGWSYFESADYVSARLKFEEALSIASDNAEAHNGLGWSILFLGLPPSNEPLDEAITAFEQALNIGLYAADPQVGLAIAHQSGGDYQSAIQYALEALGLEPTYTFRHIQTINYLDIHLVLAQSYFGSGEDYFPQAQSEADILDPDNGLDPDDNATWRVDLDRDGEIEAGETFGSYTEALMELIELLQQEIFG